MSGKSQNTNDNQEIDLSEISKKIGDFFEQIAAMIFSGILFFKRNIIWIGILFIIGAALGVYMDKNTKVYTHELIVSPNFGSTDYLYAKVEQINSKIAVGDTMFLKNVVGIKKPGKLLKIEVKPIVDIYKFIDNKAQNFELIKLMAEDGDIKKIATEELTSKNYPYHLISLLTDNETSAQQTVEPVLNYLNTSDYYSQIQKEYLNNTNLKMAANDSIIAQINVILNTFSSTANGTQKSDKLVYYNENSQLAEVIKTKDALTAEQGSHRLELISYDKIIKENSVTLNIKNNKGTNGKMKLILPFLFVFLFVLFGFFKSFYKTQMSKLNS
jgi:hypothetical protein